MLYCRLTAGGATQQRKRRQKERMQGIQMFPSPLPGTSTAHNMIGQGDVGGAMNWNSTASDDDITSEQGHDRRTSSSNMPDREGEGVGGSWQH